MNSCVITLGSIQFMSDLSYKEINIFNREKFFFSVKSKTLSVKN